MQEIKTTSALPVKTGASTAPAVPGATAADPSQGSALTAFDQSLRAFVARSAGGVSAYSTASAWFDWMWHASLAPGRGIEIGLEAAREAAKVSLSAITPDSKQSEVKDHRFEGPDWEKMPYRYWRDSFLAAERIATLATQTVPGMQPENARRVAFLAHQAMALASPANNPVTNPVVLRATLAESGANLTRGAKALAEDLRHNVSGEEPSSSIRLGIDAASTPGTVVYRNEIMELIQYAPETDMVSPEPVLVVPAWIMKYYILDLAPDRSLIRHLVQQGRTVFAISWKNPTSEDRNTSFDAYRSRGLLEALRVIETIMPGAPVHGCGYCLGGTMLAIGAAIAAREGKTPFASLTFLAAQVDFSEAGELMLFIDESQVTALEDIMREQGVLETNQMASTFRSLRSDDLIWAQAMRSYWLGQHDAETDLGAWNADPTRMPYLMHSQYLRGLFLENRLTAGRYAVDGSVVALKDIHCPLFVVGTETDHIAPWRSVYKIQLFTDTETTFVLTNGGHNAGIVSEPGHAHRRYRMNTRNMGEPYISPDAWLAQNEPRTGSWWTAWFEWINKHGSDVQVAPPAIGASDKGLPPLGPAPGTYVFGR